MPHPLTASHRTTSLIFLSFSELHCNPHICEYNSSLFPVTPIRVESGEVLKQQFLAVSLLQIWSKGERDRMCPSGLILHAVCGAANLVFILSAPPWLKYNGLGAGLWLFNLLCRFYALPPVWPICSPEYSLDVLAKAALIPIIRP